MNIIILGAGKVGSHLTNELSLQDHNILVIDHNKDVLNRLLEQNDVMALVGDGTDLNILKEANVGDCDLFIALTRDDDTNLISASLARSLGAKEIITRLRDPKYISHLDQIREISGSKLIINPEYLAAKEIQRSIKYSHARNVQSFLEERALIIEITINPNSRLNGLRLKDADSYLNQFDVLIGMVIENDQVYIPNGDFILEAGQKIYVMGSKDDVDLFYKAEIPENIRMKDILIIGASNITHHLTHLLLERHFNVTIIEINRKKAIDIQEKYSEAIVINADGSDPDILEEARIDSFDAVISLTGIDEENILIALIAQRYGIDKIISKVNRTNLLKLTGILDIDATFTPKSAASNYINRIIRSRYDARGLSYLNNLYKLEGDQVEVLEFEVGENSRIFNQRLKDVNIRPDTLVAVIEHSELNGQIEVATGNSIIDRGDRVMIITKSKNITQIDDILE
ncbi:Trk system potassium transporter TrkA [Anaerococcus sp. mt242]|uniref:Trk system potassium transporter TrkA n=1 Tax=Anaerococcus sp. mt242 TaxID=2661917 RepID=UPI001933ACD5|nr:Trk system potassium transporter TrkA [Anaerococcus sp. mt242]MBM0045660.1 Trk system potassium transporter TrkA [Anaerococcus sp. mt242]